MQEASGTSRNANFKSGPSERNRHAESPATDSSSTLHKIQDELAGLRNIMEEIWKEEKLVLHYHILGFIKK